jgi:hypothetical protein
MLNFHEFFTKNPLAEKLGSTYSMKVTAIPEKDENLVPFLTEG